MNTIEILAESTKVVANLVNNFAWKDKIEININGIPQKLLDDLNIYSVTNDDTVLSKITKRISSYDIDIQNKISPNFLDI